MNIKTNFVIGGILAFLLIVYVFYRLYIFTTSINVSRAIVIVEPRVHTLLKSVIENFDKYMDKSWDLYVFYGNLNKEVAYNATSKLVGRKVIHLPLGVDNMTALEYNHLFKKAEFWSQVDAENILVFQTDAVLCSKSTQTIENYTMYDYIGCSYDDKTIGRDAFPDWGPNHEFYGIGGLSFRKKSFMLQCIKTFIKHPDHPEDMFYSECTAKHSKQLPSAKVLNQFCTQHVYKEKSFGAHKTQADLQNKGDFYDYCPEALMLEGS